WHGAAELQQPVGVLLDASTSYRLPGNFQAPAMVLTFNGANRWTNLSDNDVTEHDKYVVYPAVSAGIQCGPDNSTPSQCSYIPTDLFNIFGDVGKTAPDRAKVVFRDLDGDSDIEFLMPKPRDNGDERFLLGRVRELPDGAEPEGPVEDTFLNWQRCQLWAD